VSEIGFQKVKQGNKLIPPGSEERTLMIVNKGEVVCEHRGRDMESTILKRYLEGDLFGIETFLISKRMSSLRAT